MPVRLILFISILVLVKTSGIQAQNLESIGKERPIKISGGLSANQIFYTSNQETTRSPYNYYLGGNLAFDIYGIQLPFSFSYSNQQTSFRQPFNQFSLHPSYKWVSGHFGYTSASYSPYTVNGHIMLGGALELKPGDKWEVGIMAGRLQKAVTADSTVDNNVPAYRRMGYGLNLKYGSSNDFARITLFRSSDDINSLSSDPGITPEENLVAGVMLSKMVFRKLLLQAEYSASALTRNLLSEDAKDKQHPLAYASWLFNPKTSTEYYNAYNAMVSYQARVFGVGLRFEQVGADYRTHGAYFFNNNFYNFTLNTNLSMFANRVKILLNIGIQEDDPENTKMSRTTRIVGSTNIAWAPSEKLNFGISYSNFTTFTNINREFLDAAFLTPYDRIDTLNYYQVAQNASLNINYVLKQTQVSSHTLIANLNAMETRDVQPVSGQQAASLFFTVNAGYQVSLRDPGVNISAMINLQKDTNPISGTFVLGPAIALTKSALDRRLLISTAIAYNRLSIIANYGNTINSRISGSFRLGESHSFQASLIAVYREQVRETRSVSQDLTATVGYNYSF